MGRVFALIELFVIGSAMLVAVTLAIAVVRVRSPRLSVSRWVHPSVLTVGETGRVDLLIQNTSARRSPRMDLTERVGPGRTAKMTIASLEGAEKATARYKLPAQRRGFLTLGPIQLERCDVLGLAVTRRSAAGTVEIPVAPQTFDVAMPVVGDGPLGRHLLAVAQRLGPGEFHHLRDYVPGDEPRDIHWRASARSETLKVREYSSQEITRCIVLLDQDTESYRSAPEGDRAFELAIVAAASIVLSSDRCGLNTRLVCGDRIDLRGPDVANRALGAFARLELGAATVDLERDPGDGLGLLVVVTSSPFASAWQVAQQVGDPTLTKIGVFTEAPGSGRFAVDASSIDSFLSGWQGLSGASTVSSEPIDRVFV